MKKVFFAVALALPVLFACGNKTVKDDPIVSPKLADYAVDLKLEKAVAIPLPLSGTKEPVQVTDINFFRGGRYMFTGTKVESKANDSILYFSGTYTTADGKTYTCSGDFSGNVDLSGATLTINGETVNVNVTKPSVTAGSMEDFIFRSWKVSVIELALDSPNIKQRITCSGNSNVSEAVKVANQASPGLLDADKLAGYDVKEISLNPGKIMVSFTGQPTYAGSLNASATSFSYNFTETFTGNFINGNASGTLQKDGNNLVATLNVKTDKLTGKMIITLAQAN